MRLLTHNFMQSTAKNTDKGYPLKIEPEEIVVEDSPVDVDLLKKMLERIEYSALVGALQQLSDHCQPTPPPIPDVLPEGDLDQSILENLYHVLFDIHVVEGHLVCPGTGRKFPIKQGIPNMILHEDEI